MEKPRQCHYYYDADAPRRLSRLDKFLYAALALLIPATIYLAVHYR